MGSVRGSKLCRVSYELLLRLNPCWEGRRARTVDKTIDSENAELKNVGAMLDYNQGRLGRAINECRGIRAGER